MSLRRPRLRAGLLVAILTALPLGLAMRAVVPANVGGPVATAGIAAGLVLPEWTVVATGAPSQPVAEMLGLPGGTPVGVPWLALALGIGVVAVGGAVGLALARHVRSHVALRRLLAASDAAPRDVQAPRRRARRPRRRSRPRRCGYATGTCLSPTAARAWRRSACRAPSPPTPTP